MPSTNKIGATDPPSLSILSQPRAGQGLGCPSGTAESGWTGHGGASQLLSSLAWEPLPQSLPTVSSRGSSSPSVASVSSTPGNGEKGEEER